MNRLLMALLFVLAMLGSACGSGTVLIEGSPTVAPTAAQPQHTGLPPVPKATGEYVEALPSPHIVGSLAEYNNVLGCLAGLTSINLPSTTISFNLENRFGNFDVVVNETMTSGRNPTQMIRYSFKGEVPAVYGAFVVVIDMTSPSLGKYYPVAWLPGMDTSFTVSSSHFEDSMIAGVTLCI